jgi:hypothetical protein
MTPSISCRPRQIEHQIASTLASEQPHVVGRVGRVLDKTLLVFQQFPLSVAPTASEVRL